MTKSKNMQIKHLGVKYTRNGKWAFQNYYQNVTGGASGRLVKQLMVMMNNGENNIIINVHSNNERVVAAFEREIAFFKQYFKTVHVELQSHSGSNLPDYK